MMSPMVKVIAPEQKSQSIHPTPAAGACQTIPMGDRFLQLGEWRLADIDGGHFSISHKDGQTCQIFRSDGTVHAGPRTDYNAWGRPVGPSQHIKFGFQFIQIGEWRVGAYDETHLTIAHIHGQVSQIFRSDGTLHNGPRTDLTTFDRPESAASGITFGEHFIQIGNFRLGDSGRSSSHSHMSVTHTAGMTIQIYRSDGGMHPGPRNDWNFQHRPSVAWTCKSLEEMAHGLCHANFGTFGDRFVQLGASRFCLSSTGTLLWYFFGLLVLFFFLFCRPNLQGVAIGRHRWLSLLHFPQGRSNGSDFPWRWNASSGSS